MSRQKERTYYTAQVAIIIGFVLSLSIGFLDLLVSLLSERPGGLSSFSTILPPLLATIGFFFLIYLILWFLVVSHLGRFLKLGAIPLAVFLALFLLQFFALDLSNNLIRAYLSPINSFKLFAMFLIYLLISVGIYFFVKAVIQTSNYRNIIVTFGLTIPFVLAEAMVFVWLYKYRAGSFSSIPSFLIYLGYIIIFLLTVVLFYRIAQSVKVVRLITIVMALVVLSPFVIWAVSRGYGVLSGAFKETDRQVRHVILLTVDTLRVDVLSCYDNQQSVPTPHIDQLAKDGVLFTKAISAAPWTLPSFSSIMTGLSPSVHMTTKSSSRLPDNLKTLAEYMRDSGYYTAAIGYNWFLRPDHNVSQGFLGYNFFPKSSLGKSFGVRLIKWSFPDKFRSEASTRDLTRLAINWLQSNYKKDFFLWIHYFDPHEPYVPPPRFLPKRKPPPGMGKEFDMKTKELRDGSYTPPLDERVWIKKLYEGEVRYVDENIGKLFSTLKSLNLYDESLIIFTSDHGEEFWDHGGYEHGHTLYNELIQVPLIVKLPMSAKKGEVSTFVSTQSIMPTILNLTGIGYDGDYLSGNSLSPLWGSNPDGFNRKPLISTGLLYFEDRESVIFDGLKYIRFLKTNREELYDLVRDPKEKTSIVNSSPESVERARGILREQKKIARELGEHYPRADIEEKVKFDKEAKQKLKAVGYLQ